MIEMIEMIEMIWVPLAGNVLRSGEGGPKGGEIVISGIWACATPVLGMGFAYGFGRFVQNTIRVLLARPCLARLVLKFQGWFGI